MNVDHVSESLGEGPPSIYDVEGQICGLRRCGGIAGVVLADLADARRQCKVCGVPGSGVLEPHVVSKFLSCLPVEHEVVTNCLHFRDGEKPQFGCVESKDLPSHGEYLLR